MTANQQAFGSTLVPFREKIKFVVFFCFLLILTCMSNISYADPDNAELTLVAIGIHYEGQPDTTWVVKDITNSPNFPVFAGQTYSATEMGIASDLSFGTVDKIALKTILNIGSETIVGWLGDRVTDGAIPPPNAANFLEIADVSNLALEDNSNKKILVKWGQSVVGGPVGTVISDM